MTAVGATLGDWRWRQSEAIRPVNEKEQITFLRKLVQGILSYRPAANPPPCPLPETGGEPDCTDSKGRWHLDAGSRGSSDRRIACSHWPACPARRRLESDCGPAYSRSFALYFSISSRFLRSPTVVGCSEPMLVSLISIARCKSGSASASRFKA